MFIRFFSLLTSFVIFWQFYIWQDGIAIMAPKKVSKDPPKKNDKDGGHSTADSTTEEAHAPDKNEKVAVSDRLITCDICLEVMHNAMNVSPCNHKFCAGCIYEWHSQQKYCPKCRWYVQDITRDPLANELIEAYLDANPGRIRSDECKHHLDERELFHLEQFNKDSSFSSILRDTFDLEDASSYSPTRDSDQDLSDEEEFSDFENSNDSYSEARDLEMKARHDIDAARIERLRREKEERDRRKSEEEAALKKEKRKSRKRANEHADTSSEDPNTPVASRLRVRPPVIPPSRTSRRLRN